MSNDPPVEVIAIDLPTLTLGEADHLERLSGAPLSASLATTAGRLMLGVALAEYRTSRGSASSNDRRSWSEISALPLVDVSSSISPSSPAGRRRPSNR